MFLFKNVTLFLLILSSSATCRNYEISINQTKSNKTTETLVSGVSAQQVRCNLSISRSLHTNSAKLFIKLKKLYMSHAQNKLQTHRQTFSQFTLKPKQISNCFFISIFIVNTIMPHQNAVLFNIYSFEPFLPRFVQVFSIFQCIKKLLPQ